MQVANATLRETHEAAIRAERPYVVAVGPTPVFTNKGELRSVMTRIVNAGHSPAIDVRKWEQIIFNAGQSEAAMEADFFKNLDFGRTSLGPPSVIAPSGDAFGVLTPPGTLTRSMEAAALSVDGGIVILGRLRYRDISGREYRTNYCFRRLAAATGSMAFCDSWNGVQ